MSVSSPAPLACNLGAIDPRVRHAHQALTSRLFQDAATVTELPNGFRVNFVSSAPRLLKVASFIANEQLCCPFLTFNVRIEPEAQLLSLSLTGGTGVKNFLRSEFAGLLKDRSI